MMIQTTRQSTLNGLSVPCVTAYHTTNHVLLVQYLTTPRTTLHGLSVKYLKWTTSSRVYLVVHHVLETLVVGWTQKHLRAQLTTSEPIV